METKRRSRIVLATIGGFVVALVAIAVVLAVQPPPEFDPATPEGAVQGYVRAVLDEDAGLAFSYLTDDVQRNCRAGELRNVTPDSARVVIAHTEITGDTAQVEVRITETYDEGPFTEGPLGGGRDTFDETLFLELDDGRWLIAERPWPIHTYCP